MISAIALVAISAARADDAQLKNRLAVERAQNVQVNRTIAVYTTGRGLGRAETATPRAETRFELRSNAHGQTRGAHVPATK